MPQRNSRRLNYAEKEGQRDDEKGVSASHKTTSERVIQLKFTRLVVYIGVGATTDINLPIINIKHFIRESFINGD